MTIPAPSMSSSGRSPRARSSLAVNHAQNQMFGSLSACAEQPARTGARRRSGRADLRVRGAAPEAIANGGRDPGRSPRARSSPAFAAYIASRCGSISACAEQPCPASADRCESRVDLRVRGAAQPSTELESNKPGRSPRARSSLSVAAPFRTASGSISACAEQPDWVRNSRVFRGVDLRVRGAAPATSCRTYPPSGRSPRARSSRRGL